MKKAVFLWLIIMILLSACVSYASEFVAYSIGAAEQRLRNSWNSHIKYLGGMTRIAGMVVDHDSGDLIIVGQIVENERPISLDEFVVALKNRVLRPDEWPLVSIDRNPDTSQTRMQTVRFEGGIEDTRMGQNLLDIDVFLKKMALGLPAVKGVKSYVKGSAQYARKSFTEQSGVVTIFWFDVDGRPRYSVDGDVLAIQDMEICVIPRIIAVSGDYEDISEIRDEAAEKFAQLVTGKYGELSSEHQELLTLRNIFSLVALSHYLSENHSESAIKSSLDFWLNEYEALEVETPREYELLSNHEIIQKHGRSKVLLVEGGVRVHATLLALKDGDFSVLKDVVLKSRPSPRSLVWSLPISGWDIPGYTPVKDKSKTCKYNDTNAGCSITKQFIDPRSFDSKASNLQFLPVGTSMNPAQPNLAVNINPGGTYVPKPSSSIALAPSNTVAFGNSLRLYGNPVSNMNLMRVAGFDDTPYTGIGTESLRNMDKLTMDTSKTMLTMIGTSGINQTMTSYNPVVTSTFSNYNPAQVTGGLTTKQIDELNRILSTQQDDVTRLGTGISQNLDWTRLSQWQQPLIEPNTGYNLKMDTPLLDNTGFNSGFKLDNGGISSFSFPSSNLGRTSSGISNTSSFSSSFPSTSSGSYSGSTSPGSGFGGFGWDPW